MTFDISFWLQLAVVFFAVALGGRLGGVGLGAAGGLGTAVLVLMGVHPGQPPVTVMLIIVSVITATSVLEASGGLDMFIGRAEKLLRRHPKAITFAAPLVCSLFTVLVGTSYVAFAVYPVVAEIAASAKVRPERPIAASVVCAGFALMASPMSASMAALVAVMSLKGILFWQILAVSVPSFFIGTFFASLSVFWKGRELEDDPEFIRRVESGQFRFLHEEQKEGWSKPDGTAKKSVAFFFAGIALAILIASVPGMRPSWIIDGKTTVLPIPSLIQMLMLATAFVMIVFCRIPTKKVVEGSIFRSGLIGVVGIFGIAWCTGTFLQEHTALLTETISAVVLEYPYLFCFAAFLISSVVFSSTVATTIMIPLGIKFGLSPEFLIGTWACCFGNFTIPGAAQIGCTAIDRTGTTKLGTWVLNHSYMFPGIVYVITASISGLFIADLIF